MVLVAEASPQVIHQVRQLMLFRLESPLFPLRSVKCRGRIV